MTDSQFLSTAMAAAGVGTEGIDLQFGERFLGSPNGRLYHKAWANGVGRTYGIKGLAKIGGGFFFVANTLFDLQTMQDGHMSEGEFYGNTALGAVSLFYLPATLASFQLSLIENVYPGGLEGYYMDQMDQFAPQNLYGYDGLR